MDFMIGEKVICICQRNAARKNNGLRIGQGYKIEDIKPGFVLVRKAQGKPARWRPQWCFQKCQRCQRKDYL